MSNFDFLKDYDEKLYKIGNRIESQVNSSPSAVKADSTTFLEHVLKILLAEAGLKYDSWKDFSDQVDSLFQSDLDIPYSYCDKIKGAYRFRNKIHDDFDEIEKHEYQDALQLHKKLFYIAKKLYRDYNDNYDAYKGTPSYKPIELDTSDDIIEQVKIPDFADIIDIEYDYCVICGEPNHSNYSICCEKCNRVMDNANNFISIRNAFGKNAQFTKEDLLEYGIPEGYANQLIAHLVREDMMRVKGRFITFNNMHFDDYLSKIDKYLMVCELLTEFIEGKITPVDIKQTKEYKQGSFHQDPFYQFYKLINIEIVNKFESYLVTTENIWESIEFTTITQNDLKRWYLRELNNYKKGKVNDSFVVFNSLLKEDYIGLKREGVLEKDIKKQLNVAPEVYEFWSSDDKEFIQKIEDIKRDLILRTIDEHKTKEEIIEIAGVTSKEYDDLVKVSDFKGDELSQKRNRELELRKEEFVKYLEDNDLETSCKLAKFSVNDFYDWYSKDTTSKFYIQSTKILMEKYLDERRTGKTKGDAAKSIGIDEKFVDYWLKRNLPLYDEFKNKNSKVIVDLCLEGFKNNKSKKEISEIVEIKVSTINSYLRLGERGSQIHRELYEYYEANIIPKSLSRFLVEIKNKPLKKSLELVELSEEKLNHYYELGRNGNEKYEDFYRKYHDFKIKTYIDVYMRKNSEDKAFRKSNFTKDEFNELKVSLNDEILLKRMEIVKNEILNDATTQKAAKKAGVTVDDIYDWYYLGKSENKYREFSEFFFDHYIEPNILHFNRLVDQGKPIENILKVFDINFTEKDFEIWQKEGLINKEDIVVSLDDDKNEEKEEENKLIKHDGYNSQLYETINDKDDDVDGLNPKDVFFPQKKPSKSAGILKQNDEDIEELKKQILKK